MSFLSKLTRSLHQAARVSNDVRIAEKLVDGNPRPLLVHEKNRVLFRLFGRFLR
jgi:hypothetical protein